MNEYQLRQNVVQIAQSFLGCKESDGSHKKIIDIYNQISPIPNGYRMKYTDPWCAAFVSAVAQSCGLTNIIFPNASCPRMIELYQRAGRWQEDEDYLPNIGDIVFYDWEDNGVGDNKGTADHVGIVSNVYSTSFNVIEGNYSDAVKQRTLKRNQKNLRGFGLPDYASMASAEPVNQTPTPTPEPTPAPAPAPSPAPSDPLLKYGARGSSVVEMQNLLIKAGYKSDLGRWGADGKFGLATWRAVRKFQQNRGLLIDGEVGPETWAALRNASGDGAEVPVDDGWQPSVGDIVQFVGNKHYASATLSNGYTCKGGRAKVTAIYKPGVAAHPYHLINLGGGCTVYGWVDADKVKRI